jgi:hypothetical protein
MSQDRKDGYGRCEHCRARFEYFLIHNGFGDTAFAYCDRCGMTALVGGWDDVNKPPEAPLRIHGPVPVETEPWLASCGCGGIFHGDASPRCPECSQPLSPQVATAWLEKNAPGTKGGWRWQQCWAGMYCIVINGRSVSNNWLAKPRNA